MAQQTANRFDTAAADWDEKPASKAIASKSSEAIRVHVPFNKSMNVMDFGCGTGLISEAVLPLVKSVHGVDAAQGMIDVFTNKIAANNLQNVTCEKKDSENELGGKTFDVIFSSFAFHHVEDISKMVSILASYLNPGGYLAIVDLDKTEKTPLFHPKSNHHDVYHHGFTAAELEKSAEPCNQFKSVKVSHAYNVGKSCEDLGGQNVEFGTHLLLCQKK